MAQQFTPFAEFIFDLVKVNEHFAESVLTSAKEKNDRTPQGSQSLMQSIVFYKDDTKTLEKGFLNLSNDLKAPSLLDLFFKNDFIIALFSDRNYVKKAFNSTKKGESNPPIGFNTIYKNTERFFDDFKPGFLAFLGQSASQMIEAREGVFKAVLKEQQKVFFDFVIAEFKSKFSKDSTFPLLPEEIVNLFINEAAGIQAAQSPDEKNSSEIAVCKMLACLLLFYLSKGRDGRGDSKQFFRMLWDYHDVLSDENTLFEGFNFCHTLFQGLTTVHGNPNFCTHELPLTSHLLIIGDGGSGKTFLAQKLLNVLNNRTQSQVIECNEIGEMKITTESIFGTAIYFKLKDFQDDFSFCSKIYQRRTELFPNLSYEEGPTPLLTLEERRIWLADFICHKYHKKLVIILDGFNEISHSHRDDLITEIRLLCNNIRKKSLRPCCVITSRPGYEKTIDEISFDKRYMLRLSSNSITNYLTSYSNLNTYYGNLGLTRRKGLTVLLSSPLILDFFVRIYQNTEPSKIPKLLNRCLIFDDACRCFIDNLEKRLKPYGELCYKFLLPDMFADVQYSQLPLDAEANNIFVKKWVDNFDIDKKQSFFDDMKPDERLDDKDGIRRSCFRMVLNKLLEFLSLGRDNIHEMLFDFFRAKAILNECLYIDAESIGLSFTQSRLHNLIELSLESNIDTALENLQTALMLAEMGEEKVSNNSSDSSAELEELYTHFSTEHKTHWPEYLFAVVNFIDTLREDSTLLLKYFFMLKPISENKDGKQNYILQQIEKYLQVAYKDEAVLYHKGALYNSLAYILNRLLDKKELETVFSEELMNLGFSDITAFKNAVVLSLLDTAQSCAVTYSKKIDEISSGRHETDMAHLLEAKIQNNYGAYYLRRYQTEANPQQKEILGRQLDKYRAESLSIKEACEQKYFQLFGKSPDCVSLGEDCAKCKKYKDANNDLSESIPACKDYRAILSSLKDSYTAMGTDHFYKAEYCEESENYKDAFCEYQIAIKMHQEGEVCYKRANGENTVALVNRLRSIGCQIRQQLLLTFTDLNKDKTLQAEQNIFDVINAMKELLNSEQIKHGVERVAFRNNIFTLSLFIFARKEVSSAYTELLSAYESLYEEFFSGRENPLPLKTEIIIAAYESLLQEAEARVKKGKFDNAFQKYEQIINNLKPLTDAAASSMDDNAFLFSMEQKIFHCQTRQVALWENLNTKKKQFNVATPAAAGAESFKGIFENRNLLLAEDSKYMENDFWEFSSELYYLVNNNIPDSNGYSLLPYLNNCKKLYRAYFDDTGTRFEELLEDILKKKKY